MFCILLTMVSYPCCCTGTPHWFQWRVRLPVVLHSKKINNGFNNLYKNISYNLYSINNIFKMGSFFKYFKQEHWFFFTVPHEMKGCPPYETGKTFQQEFFAKC